MERFWSLMTGTRHHRAQTEKGVCWLVTLRSLGAIGFRHGWIRGSSQGCLSLSAALVLQLGAHKRVKASTGTKGKSHGGNPDERCAVSPVDPAEGRHSGLGPSHPDPGNGSYSWPDLGPCSSLEYLRAREHGVHPEPSVRAVVDEEWVPQRGRGSGRAKNAFPLGPGFRSLERLFLPCSPRPQIGLRHESSAPT